jgi:transcriptional regulator NrdR family protein
MVCIYCGSQTKVTNSRTNKRYKRVWRRRMCLKCKSIISTYETVDYSRSLLVIKTNKIFEPFVRDRLFVSIYKSCGHRKNVTEDSSALTDTVIVDLINLMKVSGKIERVNIIETTDKVLSRFDKASSVQYRAYHPI